MFGQQDNTSSEATTDDKLDAIASEGTTDQPSSGISAVASVGSSSDSAQPASNEPATDVTNAISPAGGFPRATSDQFHGTATLSQLEAATAAEPAADDLIDNSHDGLIDIRHKALGELSPLIDQLDLAPEEKFRTIMMLIQDSDDQNLVKAAYEAAHTIEDEKVRARALLDIVNEINYFTQPPAET